MTTTVSRGKEASGLSAKKHTSFTFFVLEANLPLSVSIRIILVYSEGTPVSRLNFVAYKYRTIQIIQITKLIIDISEKLLVYQVNELHISNVSCSMF